MRNCLKKLLDIGDTDITVFKKLLEMEEARVAEIAKILHKDRTTVQRSLNKLVKNGLCVKKKICLNGGGYCYVYSSKNPKEVKALLIDCINKLYDEVENWEI